MAQHPISMSIEAEPPTRGKGLGGALGPGAQHAVVKMYDDEASTVQLIRFPIGGEPVVLTAPEPADEFDEAFAREMMAVNARDQDRRKAAELDG